MSERSVFSRRNALAAGISALAIGAASRDAEAQSVAADMMTTPMTPGSAMMAPTALKVPTKGTDVIAILENDHKNIFGHLAALKTADPESRKTILESLALLFSVHNSTEENFVYPAIGMVAKRPADAATLFHQQDEAKQVTWMLDHASKSGPEFDAILAKLTTAVKAHVMMEEHVDFPALKTAMTTADAAAATEKVRNFRASLGSV